MNFYTVHDFEGFVKTKLLRVWSCTKKQLTLFGCTFSIKFHKKKWILHISENLVQRGSILVDLLHHAVVCKLLACLINYCAKMSPDSHTKLVLSFNIITSPKLCFASNFTTFILSSVKRGYVGYELPRVYCQFTLIYHYLCT